MIASRAAPVFTALLMLAGPSFATPPTQLRDYQNPRTCLSYSPSLDQYLPQALDSNGNAGVVDGNSAGFTLWPPIIPNASGIYTPQAGTRSIAVYDSSAAGVAVLSDTSGNALTVPVPVGFSVLPFVPASFTTTAIATFSGVK